MKKLYFIFILFLSVFILTINSCKKDDTHPDCGCDSEILANLPSPVESTGEIWYNTRSHPKDNYYLNKYWIRSTGKDCPDYSSNIISFIIVCNKDFLTDEIINLLKSQESVCVKFSGYRKEICDKTTSPGHIYSRITLTKIEIQ